ncbi:MAG: Arc family DNA-binding protein [Oscillospiraceae bacterium]|nr:Arc family DNA-binding protein [Oscillospiraceae bacterium]
MSFDPTAYKNEFNRQAYDQITLRVPKGQREKIAQIAAERGMSTNQYILHLVKRDAEEQHE